MSKDTDYKENEIAIDKDVADPTVLKYGYTGKNVQNDKYVYIKPQLGKQVPGLIDPDCFITFENPESEYKTSTKKIDISSIPDYTILDYITDGTQKIAFSSNMEKLTVPNGGFNNWSEPPLSESFTPNVLFSNYVNSMTLTLSKPSCIFGFELEPNLFGTFTFTVEFYSGDTLVGSIVKSVTGDYPVGGARLFAAKTCCCTAFDRVVIASDVDTAGFVIAQVRYSTDCSSHCECCCETPVPVTFEECEDSKSVPITVDHFSCRGRLLIVDVNVTACENRKVAIGVLVCDNDSNVLRFKVCEACMPESATDNHCVTSTIRFCFVFGTDLCSQLSLNIKTFAEYACFDFPCNCQS